MGSYFGSFRQRPGMAKSPDRPEALQPIPEEYDGTNFPYRGVEPHGVEPTRGVDPEEYYDHDQWTAGPEKIPALEPEPEPDPVKVKIVNETARERFEFRTVHGYVNGLTAQRIVSRNDKRSTVTFRVGTGASGGIYIGPDSGLTRDTGLFLEPGQSLTIRTTEDVWGLAEKGGGTDWQDFYIVDEFSVEI